MSSHQSKPAVLVVLLWLLCCLVAARPGQAQQKAPPPAKSDAEIRERFNALVKSPTKENYLQVHKLVVASDKYDPYSADLGDAERAAKNQQPDEARAKLRQAGINVLLSPRAHMLAARLALAAGDRQAFERETAAARSCIAGILAGGDGSAEKPYPVSRVEDEYDVLRSLGKHSTKQALKMDKGKSYDVLFCDDGADIYFDVSDVFGSLKRRL